MSIFHRYKSEIHGNYRRAYLRAGAITGLLLAAYIVVRYLMGRPTASPLSYVGDAILLVALFLFAAYYLYSLPGGKVTLKEVMLFGVGLSAVAAVVYGIVLCLFGILAPGQTALFNGSYQMAADRWPVTYWAVWWAVVAAVEVLLLGSFGAFIAAIVFRNEKSETVKGKSEK